MIAVIRSSVRGPRDRTTGESVSTGFLILLGETGSVDEISSELCSVWITPERDVFHVCRSESAIGSARDVFQARIE